VIGESRGHVRKNNNGVRKNGVESVHLPAKSKDWKMFFFLKTS
jgi:hypothetical protein